MPRSTVTIRDVAALAGVSHQTVSRVINKSERVTPETRQRVEQAITELGYQPNAIARSMADGRTYTLACITPNLTDYTFASLIEGAETEARQHGYFLLTATAPDAETFELMVRLMITSRRTEGLLVINPYSDRRHEFLPKSVPLVFLGMRPRQEVGDSASIDEVEAGRLATEHLISLGHRHIAHITGPLCEDCSQDRMAGYIKALHQAGIEPNPAWIAEGDWSATFGDQASRAWLSRDAPITAIFAQNDRMAVGAIRALRDFNRRVPEDVSVIGFDNIPLASYFDPPLTTMFQDIQFIGREAARLLIQRLDEPHKPPQHLRYPAEVVIRSSTAALRGGDYSCNDTGQHNFDDTQLNPTPDPQLQKEK
jgi:LacI family repressor for deo operon, udp, cdd, tsx, nupC, and nupG